MIYDTIRLLGATTIDLPIRNAAPGDLFTLKGVTGLGAPDLNLILPGNIQQSATYQDTQAANRQIVILLGLNPNWGAGGNASDLRTMFYDLIIATDNPYIQFQLLNAGTVVVQATCYISGIESPQFVKDPEIQVTFDCTSPYLRAPSDINYDVSALSNVSQVITNGGGAPTGFRLDITFTDAVLAFTISKAGGGSLTAKLVAFTAGFAAGDRMVIDTRRGQRAAFFVRSGTTTDMASAITGTWLQLSKGNNTLNFNSNKFNYNALVSTYLYWGV